MNYNRIYFSIIDRRKLCHPIGYTELHHIIPKSLGGTNSADNLVYLSAREHFICHLLLVKIYQDTHHYHKMVKAFFMMLVNSSIQCRYSPSRSYAKLKEEFSRAQSDSQQGAGNSQFGTRWVTDLSNHVSFKLAVSVNLPNGCVEGRNKKEQICPCCSKLFIPQKTNLCCSKICANTMIGTASKNSLKVIPNRISVTVDDIVYSSISDAARQLGINGETARRRFSSTAFPHWVKN